MSMPIRKKVAMGALFVLVALFALACFENWVWLMRLIVVANFFIIFLANPGSLNMQHPPTSLPTLVIAGVFAVILVWIAAAVLSQPLVPIMVIAGGYGLIAFFAIRRGTPTPKD